MKTSQTSRHIKHALLTTLALVISQSAQAYFDGTLEYLAKSRLSFDEKVRTMSVCNFNGIKVYQEGTAIAYRHAKAPAGTYCIGQSELRKCTPQGLTGSFLNSSCSDDAGDFDQTAKPLVVNSLGKFISWSPYKRPAPRYKALASGPLSLQHSGKYIDIYQGQRADGTPVHQWDAHSGVTTQFDFIQREGGYFLIRSRYDGRCLDIANVSGANGAAVHMWTCLGGANQLFKPVGAGDRAYKLQAKHSNRCLMVYGGTNSNGARLVQWDCMDLGYFHFYVPQAVAATAPQPAQIYANGPLPVQHSGRCLDIYEGRRADGTPLHQWDCHGGLSTQFEFIPKPDGFYQIRSKHDRRCIDVQGASTGNGAAVHMWTCFDGPNQFFKPVAVGNGFARLVAKHSNRCLNISGGGVGNGVRLIQWDCLDHPANFFKMPYGVTLSAPPQVAPPQPQTVTGSMRLQHSGKCVDLYEQRRSDGTPIHQWDCRGGSSAQFDFIPKDSGYYEIKSRHDGRCIDIEAQSTENGANAHMWSCFGGRTQQFKPVHVGNGYYKLVSRHSNRCLNIAGESYDNGGRMIQWDCLDKGDFYFRLPDGIR